jgi:hypothetical protein
MVMKQILIIVLISSFIFTGCSGTNEYLNNRNVLGLGGAAGGAYAGSQLCKNCKGAAKIAAIAGGSILSMFAFSKVGEMIDKNDVERQKKLIQDVLEKNKDNETSTTTYTKSWRNPNTGQTQQAPVQQSATPLRTYQPNNLYAQNNIQQSGIIPLPRNDGCEVGCRRPQIPLYQSNNTSICRDVEITFSISVDGGPPARQQYYRMCRTHEGWKTIQ